MPKHILCADDSVTMQKVYSITFAHTDYQVAGARSSDEALAAAQKQRPDLVLADAVMPGKTGYDLCMALKSDPALRGVPVVIVCGNSQPYDEARGKQVGADATLTKPWDTQIFIDKVGEILARTAQHGVAQVSAVAPPVAPARTPSVPPPPRPIATPAPAAAATVGPSAPPPGLGRPLPPPVALTPPPPAVVPPQPAPVRAPPAAPSPSMQTGALPKPPPGLPRPAGISRPPLIRGATTAPRPLGAGPGPAPVRPATGAPLAPNRAPLAGQGPAGLPTPSHATGAVQAAAPQPQAPQPPLNPAQAAAAAAAQQQQRNTARNATIMGMPAMAFPTAPSPVAPPAAPTPPPAAPSPFGARPAAPVVSPPTPTPPVSIVPEPPPVARPLPGTDALADAAKRVAAAGMLATQEAVQAKGMDPRGVEYEAIAKLSREIIEKIAWEVVPELAETIIRENLDRLARK